MARKCKPRRICAMPRCRQFGPLENKMESSKTVVMTIDEYEAIRLIDLEGKSQEECAIQMEVARTTVQAIYNNARIKLAHLLVNGQNLQIKGGEYALCDGSGEHRGKPCFQGLSRNQLKHSRKMEEHMIIAVTYENGKVFQHFGHSEQFKIYEVEDKKIVKSEVVDTNGSGHGLLAGFLGNYKVNVLICGGIGGGARNALAEAGIELYPGVTGEADTSVEALLNGTLNYDPDTMCNHHDHEHGEGHTCGDHGCH